MKKTKKTDNYSKIKAGFYCYMSGDACVFLNRWDEVIQTFYSYEDALEYAKENLHLIDVAKPDAYNFRIWNKNKEYPPYPKT